MYRVARRLFLAVLLLPFLSYGLWAQGNDPLPSWSEGANKQAIVEFVSKVTKEGRR